MNRFHRPNRNLILSTAELFVAFVFSFDGNKWRLSIGQFYFFSRQQLGGAVSTVTTQKSDSYQCTAK